MDMMTEVFNVGDKVECVRDSPDNNDSIAIGVQGVICVIVDSSPHIGVRWNEKVVGGHDCHGACSHGYGWFVTPCDIKRIDDDDEFCETLYNGAIDDERYMKPEVKCATIRKWCLPRRGSSVILIVE